MSSPYNFWTNRIEITISNSFCIILCLSVAAETCVNFVATVWFSRVYNFQFSYSWKTCSVTSWFPRINLSAATRLRQFAFHKRPTCHNIKHFEILTSLPQSCNVLGIGRGGLKYQLNLILIHKLKRVLLRNVQTGSDAHPVSYPTGPVDYLRGGEEAGARTSPLTSIYYRDQE
jgi:hypothetical protein